MIQLGAIAGKLGAIFQNYASNDKSKLIADFQDDETWTSGAGTQSDDGVNYRLGVESIKILENDNSAGLLYSDMNGVNLNLAQFASGAASDTADYIYLICYVSDVTKVSSIHLGFSDEATYDGSPAFDITISSGIITGWNYIKIKKSAFTAVGGITLWSGIQSVNVGWTSTINAQNAYVSFQAIYLVDADYDLVLANNTAYTMVQKTLCYSWSLDTSCEMLDATAFGSEWKSNITGLSEFKTSIEKFWENGNDFNNLGSELAIVLYVNTTEGYRYEGLGLISSDSTETPVDAVVGETLEFTGDGELYYTNLLIVNS